MPAEFVAEANFTANVNFDLSGPQHDFVFSTKPYSLFFAGYGTGKSYAEVCATVLMALQNPGGLIGLGSMDFPRLEITVVDPLRKMLDAQGIPYVEDRGDRQIILHEDWGGATIQLLSLLNPKTLAGPNFSGFVGDEASMWRADIPGLPGTTPWNLIRSRMRVAGATNQIKLGTTPEGWSNWVTETFIHGPDDPEQRLYWERNYHVTYGSTYDNEHNLMPGYIDLLRGGLTRGQVMEKIFGRADRGKGKAAYYAFDRTQHVKATRYDWRRGMVGVGLDYNVSPMCAVMGQFWRNKFWVFSEIAIEDNADTRIMARAIKARALDLGIPIDNVTVFPDATGARRDTRSGTTDTKILQKAGLHVRAGRVNPNVRGRLENVNAVLEHMDVQIDPSCVWLTRDLTKCEKHPDGSLVKDPKGLLTHSSDGFGYWVCQERPIVGRGGIQVGLR